ncbi:hypothetical protein GCM10012288_07290 [Malaciobacter pacificus]|uniref:histidine kinase n=1 Tax=Malaciobacter pacificus TaxID=1080223 RepID=A0A5C2H9X2_9BACT|nr:transporter substrate-binding domain-containing protein [Malaciobacter pacificus]QEP34016.1 BvgS-like domain-containing signal transduction sensor histidine kinase [Malaciobacter pacificus]GGD35855.1 hypothetical protein GCM10012288_07290 [Malaciobacter pacificus]
MIKILVALLLPIILFSKTIFSEDEIEYIKNKKIILVSNEYFYEPYDYNIDGVAKGYSIDLLEMLLEDSGLKIKYITKDWNELLNDLENNNIDLMHTMYKTANREIKFNFSTPYSRSVNVYVIRKDGPNISNIKDLYGKKVGVIKGWSEENFFNQYSEVSKIYYKSFQDKLEALSTGEIDAIISSEDVANYYIKKYGFFSLKVSTIVKENFARKLNSLHFATNINNPTLISIINKAYNNLSVQKLEQLNKKWFGDFTNSRITLNNEEKKYLRNKKNINMCIDPNWEPLEFFDSKGNYKGISADYFKLYSNVLGIDFNVIKTENWSQTLKYAQNRKCDIISLAMKTPKREEYLKFTSTYLKLPLVVATKLDIPFIEDIKDLYNKPIGIIKNNAISEIIKTKHPEINIVEVKNIEEGMKLVSKGEIFGYVDTLTTISSFFQTRQRDQVKIAGKLNLNWELGIAVRNDDLILFDILEKAIKTISEEDKRKILNKWISIKFEQVVDYTIMWQILVFVLFIFALFIYKQYLLKKSINEFSKLIDSTLEAIIIFKNDKCINANKRAVKIFKYKSKELIKGKSPYDFISEDSEEYFKTKINDNYKYPFEVFAKKNEDKTFYALVSFYKIKDKNISVLSVVDITDIKELENKTKQAQMGEMIENIAHQWRQPLSTISTLASSVNVSHKVGIEQDMNIVSDNMEKIVNTTQYLSDTIDTFRNFLKEKKEFKKVVLQERINTAIEIVSGSLSHNGIELKNNIDKNPIELYLYLGELGQVLINILNNAIDALKERDIENPWIEISMKKYDEKVILTIEDNAGGIDNNLLNKIFDPYFTTKHSSQGTGLGLYMSYKIIVESLHGKLNVINTNKGAKFIIEIPIVTENSIS